MIQATLSDRRPRRPRGFSMVELLVVIGIIVILISIVIPVVHSVRVRAQEANTRSQLNVLRMAIDAYHTTFGAYPGPLSNHQVCGLAPSPVPNVTMAENLFLGLIGGLVPRAATEYPAVPVYQPDAARLGQGPFNFGVNPPRQMKPFIDNWAGMVSAEGRPCFTSADVGFNSADSRIPEFMDRFEPDMPFLYLRALPGAQGIVTESGNVLAQYDLRQVRGYTNVDLYGRRQGLRSLGNFTAPLSTRDPNDALPYLRDPANPGPNPAAGNPRAKDTYILISAGRDGTYGTTDDITSFGGIVP